MIIEVKLASRMQLKKMFLRFFPSELEKACEFSIKLPEQELSLAQVQGYLLEHRENACSALENSEKLLFRARPEKGKVCTIANHLRRGGFERYSWVFNAYGFYTREETLNAKLSISKLTKMSFRFKFIPTSFKELIEGDKKIMDKHKIADLSFVRDCFVRRFGLKSFDSKRCQLAGNASCWIVERIISLSEKVEDAITISERYIDEMQSRPKKLDWMTIFEFLKRVGLDSIVHAFIEKKYEFVMDIKDFDEEKLKTIVDDDESSVSKILKLLSDNPNYKLKREFTMPFTGISDFVLSTFKDATEHDARMYSKQASDFLGRAECSWFQIERHLSKFENVKQAIEDTVGIAKMKDFTTLPPPPPTKTNENNPKSSGRLRRLLKKIKSNGLKKSK